ncbi:14372_t:CDS:1, partial [Funneliformis mosseae]
ELSPDRNHVTSALPMITDQTNATEDYEDMYFDDEFEHDSTPQSVKETNEELPKVPENVDDN